MDMGFREGETRTVFRFCNLTARRDYESLRVSLIYESCSNLNHFQFAHILASLSKGRVSVGRDSDLGLTETTGSFCRYFLAISSASENTLFQGSKNWYQTSYRKWTKNHTLYCLLKSRINKKIICTSLSETNRPGSLSRSAILQCKQSCHCQTLSATICYLQRFSNIDNLYSNLAQALGIYPTSHAHAKIFNRYNLENVQKVSN